MQAHKDQYDRLRSVCTCCAEMKINAEAKRAEEIALQKLQSVLDILRIMRPLLYREQSNVKIGLAEHSTFSLRVITQIRDDMSNANFNLQRLGAFEYFVLSEANLEKMDKLDIKYLLSLVDKDSFENEVEEKIFQAIHWLSDAELQSETSNKILSLTTCLETFFSPPKDSGLPISNTISESIALLSSEDREKRKANKKLIKNLYNIRSRVTHGSSLLVTERDIHNLREIAYWSLAFAIKNREKYKTLEDIRQVVEDLKMT